MTTPPSLALPTSLPPLPPAAETPLGGASRHVHVFTEDDVERPPLLRVSSSCGLAEHDELPFTESTPSGAPSLLRLPTDVPSRRHSVAFCCDTHADDDDEGVRFIDDDDEAPPTASTAALGSFVTPPPGSERLHHPDDFRLDAFLLEQASSGTTHHQQGQTQRARTSSMYSDNSAAAASGHAYPGGGTSHNASVVTNRSFRVRGSSTASRSAYAELDAGILSTRSSEETPTHLSAASPLLGRGRFGSVTALRSPNANAQDPVCVVGDLAVKSVSAASEPTAAAAELAFARRYLNTFDADGSDGHGKPDNIVKVIEAAHDADACEVTVTMELLEGGRVDHHRAFTGAPAELSPSDLRFRRERLQRVARDLFSGLSALHNDLRTIHRDLTPRNVLLDADGTAKIVDFGVAALLADGVTTADDQVGSVLYMAPERLRGAPYSFNGDTWSAGVTLLQLALGGLHPFVGGGRDSPAEGGMRDRFWALAEVLKHTASDAECFAATDAAVTRAVNDALLEPAAADFLRRCLDPNVATRPAPSDLLTHPWIRQAPSLPQQCEELPSSGSP